MVDRYTDRQLVAIQKVIDEKVSELKSEIAVLKRDRDALRTELDNIQNSEDRVNELNGRVREAMEHIANEFGVSLMSLFDPVERR